MGYTFTDFVREEAIEKNAIYEDPEYFDDIMGYGVGITDPYFYQVQFFNMGFLGLIYNLMNGDGLWLSLYKMAFAQDFTAKSLYQWARDGLISFFESAFFTLGSPAILPYTWSQKLIQQKKTEELWDLVLESDDELTWKEGIFFHFLSAQLPIDWNDIEEFWCGGTCFKWEIRFFDNRYNPYGLLAITSTTGIDAFEFFLYGLASFVKFPIMVALMPARWIQTKVLNWLFKKSKLDEQLEGLSTDNYDSYLALVTSIQLMIWNLFMIPIRLLWLPIKWVLAFNAWIYGIFAPIIMWCYNIIMWPVHFTQKIMGWFWNLLTWPIQLIIAIQTAILAWIEENMPFIWKIIVRYEYLSGLPLQTFLLFAPVDIVLILADTELTIVEKATAIFKMVFLGVEVVEEISEEE